MRIDADAGEGEFGHVGAADQHRARLLEPRHDRGVAGGGRGIGQGRRSRARDLALDVEQILDRDRQARERRGDVAGGAQPVLRVRDVARMLVKGEISRGIGDMGERVFNQRATAGAARGERGGKIEHGSVRGRKLRHGVVLRGVA